MVTILDGKKIRDERKEFLSKKIFALDSVPKLVVFQVGKNQASDSYIKQKEIFGKTIGVEVTREVFPESVSEDEILQKIEKYNSDDKFRGIIVQLPLSPHLDIFKISSKINPKKDIDGFSGENIKALFGGREGFVPATTRGILDLLDYYKLEIQGKNVCIVGRSELVGKPTAIALINRDATVEVCHSKTKDLKEKTKRAQILITAVGKPKFITKEFVSPEQVIIDVGISREGDGSLVGDVDFEEVSGVVSAITPVPGGVGPMTVLSLFENLVDACGKEL